MDNWQFYNNFKVIEADLITLLRYVELNENNYKTTSAEIKKIILSACAFVEQSYPFLLDELKLTDKSNVKKSMASKIYNITCSKNCSLTNLIPKIQNQNFYPWRPTEPDKDDTCKFAWWDAYNALKHVNSDKDLKIEFFKSAIDSVAALFSVTVFLTSRTAINHFWHANDFIQIQTTSLKPQSIYNNTSKALRKQIWPDCNN